MTDSRIAMESRALAFMDVLGSAALAKSAGEDMRAFKKLYRACQVGSRFKALVSDKQQTLDFPAPSMRVTTFSDLVAISVEDKPDDVFALVLRTIMHFAVAARMGIVNRGALVVGKMTHTEDLIFGPALVEAHDLERHHAKVPRILVQPAIVPRFRQGLLIFNRLDTRSKSDVDSVESLVRKVFLVDYDGKPFLNTFHAADSKELNIIHKMARDRLRSMPEHREKYEWLKRQVERQLATQ